MYIIIYVQQTRSSLQFKACTVQCNGGRCLLNTVPVGKQEAALLAPQNPESAFWTKSPTHPFFALSYHLYVYCSVGWTKSPTHTPTLHCAAICTLCSSLYPFRTLSRCIMFSHHNTYILYPGCSCLYLHFFCFRIYILICVNQCIGYLNSVYCVYCPPVYNV